MNAIIITTIIATIMPTIMTIKVSGPWRMDHGPGWT